MCTLTCNGLFANKDSDMAEGEQFDQDASGSIDRNEMHDAIKHINPHFNVNGIVSARASFYAYVHCARM